MSFFTAYKSKQIWTHVSVFVLFFILYALVIKMDNQDLSFHAQFAAEMSNGERLWASNIILYWLMAAFSFFGSNLFLYKINLSLLLAFASTYKFSWCRHQIEQIKLIPDASNKEFILNTLIAFSLLFVFVIPIPSYFLSHYFYLGNFVPTVWHNSTTIFLFPFAIILFYESYKQIERFTHKRNNLIALLILLNIFIKPSFFFVFAIAYPLFLLIRYKFSKQFWLSILPVLIGGICILAQYYLIYTLNSGVDSDSSVIIDLFFSYREYTPLKYLPLALIFSLLFPIAYFLSNSKKMIKNKLNWYIIVSLIISLLIYFVFTETGARASHGNFYWQIVICVWLAYFQTLFFLLKDIKNEGFIIKNKLLTLLYSIHVILGIIYLIRMYIIGHFF